VFFSSNFYAVLKLYNSDVSWVLKAFKNITYITDNVTIL